MATTAKRQRTSLDPSTTEELKEKPLRRICIGSFVLPAGFESACGIMLNILQYLNIVSLCNVKRSSLIQQCRKAFGSDDFERVRDIALALSYKGRRSINEIRVTHPARRLYLLIERYKNEFPRGTRYGFAIPTPIVCACEKGRLEDVELFVKLHPYHKYITNRGVNGYREDMTLKDMMSQVGTDSDGDEYTPLMAAAMNEHFHIVNYLIKNGADPTIADSSGFNALHYAAWLNRTNIKVIDFLLTHMPLTSINKQNGWGKTPLDYTYRNNRSPIRQAIIDLMRSKGAKAYWFDERG